MIQERLIQRGSEAEIILRGKDVIKRRIKKSYRILELDEKIRKLRTRSEAKLLKKASEIIDTPKLIGVNEKEREIVMDFIPGKRLSRILNEMNLKEQKKICRIIGGNIAKIHRLNIIHGDITTSNMVLYEKEKTKIFFLDFGLGFISQKNEDKAVDIHLLKQAIEAKHFQNWKELFEEICEGYKTYEKSNEVLNQLRKVESRGRYKEKY
ncbi:Kae1-associated serine/threonine protein kinase [Patescibacteria group bacterium]|nr:Kae1-associated serine/threonine protein kinase [Patescibacteria group bacterium]